VGQRDALKYETPGQKAGFIRNIILNNYDKDLVKKQLNILENLTTEELNVLIRKYINPNKLAVIVVGDRAIVLEKLKALGYPVIETDMYGNPIQ
jgi:zinc protease